MDNQQFGMQPMGQSMGQAYGQPMGQPYGMAPQQPSRTTTYVLVAIAIALLLYVFLNVSNSDPGILTSEQQATQNAAAEAKANAAAMEQAAAAATAQATGGTVVTQPPITVQPPAVAVPQASGPPVVVQPPPVVVQPPPIVVPQTYPTQWQCLPGFSEVLRRENNANRDLSCASVNGRDCYRAGGTCEQSLAQVRAMASVNTLTCGDDHRSKHGRTGYGWPEHWCTRADPLISKA